MRPRLIIITAIVLIETLWLLGVATPATDAPGYEIYTIGTQGESLSSIAADYDIPVDVLARFNNLQASSQLRPGMRILVPTHIEIPPQETMNSEAGFPDSASGSQRSTVRALADDEIEGMLAYVTAERTSIYSAPAGGEIIWNKLTRGKDLLVIGQTETHYGVLMNNGAIGWVPRIAIKLTDVRQVVKRPSEQEVAQTSPGRQDIIDTAFTYLNTPYEYGGSLPDTVDCSLLVQTVFRKHGIKLPRTAAQQFTQGTPIDVSDLIPGDRVYFYDPGMKRIGHTGIYIGNGRFIHASSNRGRVAVDLLSNSPYNKRYAGARR